ncbi:MAG: lytic murein transglycosylase B [Pseudomonadota bacterium]
MNYKLITLLLSTALTLGACSSTEKKEDKFAATMLPGTKSSTPMVGNYRASRLTGDYAGYKSTKHFIKKMERQYGFDRSYLNGLFSRVERRNSVLRLMNRYSPSKGPVSPGNWDRYSRKFLTSDRIAKGAAFWSRNRHALQRAERQYGVPPEYIVAIIGVETIYGGNVGRSPVFDSIATIAFDYPRRSDYFTSELEQYLLMAREERFDPRSKRGSYAGAMGLGQFMPSSFRKYAVDFNGDGRRNLWDPYDAIGSVASYFQGHGWRKGEGVAVRATHSGSGYKAMKTGFDSNHSLGRLKRAGVTPAASISNRQVSLLSFSRYTGNELWLGKPNFYVITRYNHSSNYAMAVHQLAQAVKRRYSSMRYAYQQETGEAGS